ncbi:hypothetical protein [Methylobacterium gregans]
MTTSVSPEADIAPARADRYHGQVRTCCLQLACDDQVAGFL